MHIHTNQAIPIKKQRGAALIIGLVLLISLTIIGIGVMSTTSLEQRMAGNMTEMNLAFNCAETGAKAIEEAIAQIADDPNFLCQRMGTGNCLSVHRQEDIDTANNAWWEANAIDLGQTNLLQGDRFIPDVQRQPQAIIQQITIPNTPVIGQQEAKYRGNSYSIFRVTVRCTGTTGDAEAVVTQDIIMD